MTGGEDTSGSVLQTTRDRRITATVAKHIVKTKSAGATPPEASTSNALYNNILHKQNILHAAPANFVLAIYRNINYFLYIHNVIFLIFAFGRNTAAHIQTEDKYLQR